MFAFFDTIISVISSLWTMLLNVWDNFFTFIEIIIAALALPPTLGTFMPPIIGASVTVVAAVGIIKLIVGIFT